MLLLPIIGAVVAPLVLALGEQRVIFFPKHASSDFETGSAQAVFSAKHETGFTIASKSEHYVAPFLLDSKDDIAIHLAAKTLARDIHTITGIEPRLYNDSLPSNISHAIIMGSIGSDVIQDIKCGKDERDVIKGKWESYDVRVSKTPVKHLDSGLVITGSDRVSLFPIYHNDNTHPLINQADLQRGTVYAIYTLSEQMGVSPFHYWADVPIRPQSNIAFNSSMTLSHGEPTVKYRGLFINDEHPAMWTWAAEKYKTPKGKGAFTTDVYGPWFEMMLRLKGNYFWPASTFSTSSLVCNTSHDSVRKYV